ncbi:MAG: ATP synthase F1 subunit epsilon [Solirubrobacteraceae bacterium]
MAHEKFKAEVLTPDGEVFNEEVEMISTRTAVGSIGILAHHQPILAMLDPTELRLYKSESDIVSFAQSEGYLQMIENQALILVEEAHEAGELDAGELRDRVAQAERERDDAGEDSEKRRVAVRDLKRWEAFLRIAEGS